MGFRASFRETLYDPRISLRFFRSVGMTWCGGRVQREQLSRVLVKRHGSPCQDELDHAAEHVQVERFPEFGVSNGTHPESLQQRHDDFASRAGLSKIARYLVEEEGGFVESVKTVAGFNFAGRGQGSGMAFVQLKLWDERKSSVFDVVGRIMERFGRLKEAQVIAFAPPAIQELGNAMGFDLFLEDRSGGTHENLIRARNRFLDLAAKNPSLNLVRPNGMNDEPQYQLLIDDEKVRVQELSLSDVDSTMSAAWGSACVNDFIDRGRVKKVLYSRHRRFAPFP